MENDEDDPRNAWISNKGADAESVRTFDELCDGSYYTRRTKVAWRRLARTFPELIEVFKLVVKNRKNRRESIDELAPRRKFDRKAANALYWSHLKKSHFSSKSNKHRGLNGVRSIAGNGFADENREKT